MQKHVKWIVVAAGLALALYMAHHFNLVAAIRAAHGG